MLILLRVFYLFENIVYIKEAHLNFHFSLKFSSLTTAISMSEKKIHRIYDKFSEKMLVMLLRCLLCLDWSFVKGICLWYLEQRMLEII